MMETPLDMLSRAASMVETDRVNGEAAIRQNMDQHESPPKELPTKMLKYRRMKERQQITPTITMDDDRNNSKKCAGTQTPFTSFGSDQPYPQSQQSPTEKYHRPNSDSSYHILDLDKAKTQHSSPVTHTVTPILYGGLPTTHPGTNSLTVPSHGTRDSNCSPLNLSVTSVPPGVQLPHQSRPSVITCASATSNNRLHNGNSVGRNSPQMMGAEPRIVLQEAGAAGEMCDPAIEEHFRRSLGKSYPEYLASNASAPQMRPSSPDVPPESPTMQQPAEPNNGVNSNTAVSITGSVDDHFAKSLGDTWKQIKAKEAMQMDIFAGSVDDHFAKALGDTWLRIKAEKEGSDSSDSGSSGSPCPQPSLVPS